MSLLQVVDIILNAVSQDGNADISLPTAQAAFVNDKNSPPSKASNNLHQNGNADISLPTAQAAFVDDKNSPPSNNLHQNGLKANTSETNLSSSPSPLSAKEAVQQPSTSKFTVSDGDSTIKELKEQIESLDNLLVLKEKEWNAILRLKKHMEYVLAHVERIPAMVKEQDEMIGALSTADIKDCLELIMPQKDKFSLSKIQIQENIQKLEMEENMLKTKFISKSPSGFNGVTTNNGTGGESKPSSAAMAKERKRKRKAESGTHASNAPTHGDKLGQNKILNMDSGFWYTKTLEQLLAISAAGVQQKQNNATGSFITTAAPSAPLRTRALSPSNKSKRWKPPSTGRPPRISLSFLKYPIKKRNHVSKKTAAEILYGKRPTSEAASFLPSANMKETPVVETEVNSLPNNKNEKVAKMDFTHEVEQEPKIKLEICQGCNERNALYVCAACKNQWYCSTGCQIVHWDEHSQSCSV